MKDKDVSFRVFTTRADTIFGITYVVLAPESPLVDKVVTEENKQIVEDYKLQCSKINEIERLSSSREKTGVFTGSYAINPINGREVPILVADYVLASYGTGAVMGVAAHDDRDYVSRKARLAHRKSNKEQGRLARRSALYRLRHNVQQRRI